MNVEVTMDCTAPRAFRRLDYGAFFDSAMDQLRDERRYRAFADLERQAGRFPHAIWHSPAGQREVVIWCSNHPLIELERELASLHGKEAALVFTSGYVSNQTGVATMYCVLASSKNQTLERFSHRTAPL